MESTGQKTRIKKTAEQVAILNQMRDAGMTSTRDKQKIAEAAKRTNLPKRTVQEWINNKRKPNRGASRKRSSKPPNVYTAFMAGSFSEQEIQYLAEGKTLGFITKIRAARYRELQKTAEGRKFLEENLHKDSNAHKQDLTDAQKQARVNGMTKAIEKEAEKLQKFGYTCVAIIAQPDDAPVILGAADGVFFFQNRTRVTEDYDDYIRKEGHGVQDTKPVMARRIQRIFNQLYAEASGMPDQPVPYAAIAEGLPVAITGLPEGIPLKKPGSYRTDQMKLILQVASSLKVTIGRMEHTSPSNTHPQDSVPLDDGPNGDSPRMPNEGVSVADGPNGVSPMIPTQECPRNGEEDGICANSSAEEILSTMSIQPVVSVSPDPEVATETDDGLVVDTEAPTASEALSYAQELARQAESAQTQKKVSRGRRSKFVGKEISHLWIHGKGKKTTSRWYKGVILQLEDKGYYIRYEDGKNLHVPVQDFKQFRRKKTLFVL